MINKNHTFEQLRTRLIKYYEFFNNYFYYEILYINKSWVYNIYFKNINLGIILKI